MNASAKIKPPVAKVLDDELSEAALDKRLAERRDEIEALLAEAREAKARGAFSPLEPLHAFLKRARARFKAGS
ncbi:MAG TPA: hypothetical protein VGF56_16445 [Rhizomicrobium sp.]|jgi:hypothetical protein